MSASPFARAPVFAAAVVAAIAADQAVKLLVEAALPLREAVPVLPFLALFRTYNDGIAFSLLSGFGGLGLAAVATVVSLFILHIWRQTPPERVLAHPGYALIIGGAMGNLIDRLLHGHVIDYMLFHTGTWSFAVFNLADSFITVGAGLVLLDELVLWLRQRRESGNGEN